MSNAMWLGVTREQFADDLRSRFRVAESSVTDLTEKFANLSTQLRDEFSSFWQTGHVNGKLSVQGYSIDDLIEKKMMTPIGAFGVLDWLIRDPQAAKRALNSHTSHYNPA